MGRGCCTAVPPYRCTADPRSVRDRQRRMALGEVGPLCVLFVGPRPLKGGTWQKILIFFEMFVRLRGRNFVNFQKATVCTHLSNCLTINILKKYCYYTWALERPNICTILSQKNNKCSSSPRPYGWCAYLFLQMFCVRGPCCTKSQSQYFKKEPNPIKF